MVAVPPASARVEVPNPKRTADEGFCQEDDTPPRRTAQGSPSSTPARRFPKRSAPSSGRGPHPALPGAQEAQRRGPSPRRDAAQRRSHISAAYQSGNAARASACSRPRSSARTQAPVDSREGFASSEQRAAGAAVALFLHERERWPGVLAGLRALRDPCQVEGRGVDIARRDLGDSLAHRLGRAAVDGVGVHRSQLVAIARALRLVRGRQLPIGKPVRLLEMADGVVVATVAVGPRALLIERTALRRRGARRDGGARGRLQDSTLSECADSPASFAAARSRAHARSPRARAPPRRAHLRAMQRDPTRTLRGASHRRRYEQTHARCTGGKRSANATSPPARRESRPT